MNDAELVLLGDADLERLTDAELERYLDLLQAEEREWYLEPRQRTAEALSAEVDALLYGGAAGGGKTDWVCWHAHNLSLQHRGHRTLAVRRTFPQLKDSLIRRSLEKFDLARAKYHVGDREWTFDNGSTVRFGFMDAEDDYRHYLSAEYDCIIFEEATEFTELQFRMLRSRCRTTAAKRRRGIRPHVVLASNPGQVGHAWVKAMFVTSTNYGESTSSVEVEAMGRRQVLTVGFVPAKVSDNRHIDPDYVFNLASLPEVQRRQYLDGDWDIFEGQFFTDWSHDVHVIDPWEIPQEWTRVRGLDYGFRAPFCCLWVAFDWDGNGVVYREAYQTNATATEQARLVLARSVLPSGDPERIALTVADPSIWAKGGTGMSIEQQYRAEGLIARKAMNARVAGWSRVRQWLLGSNVPSSPHFGPTLRVMTTCPNLIRTTPDMVIDRDNPEDLDTDLEDHVLDALRYVLMSRPQLPKRTRTATRTLEDEVWAEVRAMGRDRPGVHPVLGRP